MQYLLLLYGEEPTREPSPEELEATMAEWYAYDKAIRDTAVVLASEALEPVRTATTVRTKGEERVVTDGPFAETRETLGGFYLIDVPDLDAALDWAAKCPAARDGSVEIRPIMEIPPA